MEGVFGVSAKWAIFIIVFWIVLAIVVLGPDALYDNTVAIVATFLALGTTLLIGHFGWEILILPSLVVLSVVGYLLWLIISGR